MKKLAVQAFAKAGAGLLLCALLLFGPAGTLHWVGAWRFLAALFLPMVVVGVLLLAYPAVLVPRILNEETVLKEGLPGYEAYMKKIRWRLIPFVW